MSAVPVSWRASRSEATVNYPLSPSPILCTDMWFCQRKWWKWYPRRIWWRRPSGGPLECNSRAAGYTTWSISRSPIFCYFGVPRRRTRGGSRSSRSRISTGGSNFWYTYLHKFAHRNAHPAAATAACVRLYWWWWLLAKQLLLQQQQEPQQSALWRGLRRT